MSYSRKLKIAQVAPFEERVPPEKYGGTELVINNLTEELVARGHHVTLLASGNSVTKAKLVPIFKTAIRQQAQIGDNLQNREAAKFIGIAKVVDYLRKNNFDVIHNHIGWRLLPFSSFLKPPLITTLHGPLDIAYQQFVYGKFLKANYISISNNQRRPMSQLNFIATVYNGIDINKFTFNSKPKGYLAFLGRMSPEKGPLQAIQAAKRSKTPLIMAAKVDLVDRAYFIKKIKPLIDGRLIRFIGEVDHQAKVRLLKNAIALLALIQWEEPFGLFITESLACGTPVIANKRGSVPELIKQGKTGYIVNNVNDAAAAVKKIDKINRYNCRQDAEERFSTQQMTNGYEQAYYRLLGTGAWANDRWKSSQRPC